MMVDDWKGDVAKLMTIIVLLPAGIILSIGLSIIIVIIIARWLGL
jgi:hypothetical protein